MRIAVISESYPPTISGVAVFARNLAHGLREKGHEVIVCCASRTGKPYIEYDEDIPVYRIRSIPNPIRKKFRIVVRQDRTLAKILATFNPDVIHIQDPGGSCAASVKFAKKHNVPLVGTYHLSMQFVASYFPYGKYLPRSITPFVKAYCNDLYNECAVISCPTETVRKTIVEQGIKAPVVVISNGIDIHSHLANIARVSHEGAAHPQLLSVGRIDEDKNLMIILRAIPLILAHYPVRLTIVGDGNKLATYKQWVRRHLLEDVIQFKGSVPSESPELAEEFEKADIFLIPCRIETQSIVTMEAMVAGLPVIGARDGALPELIQAGKTGLLVSPVTSRAFANAVTQLLGKPQDMVRFGKEAREAIKIHSLDQTIERFDALYKELCA